MSTVSRESKRRKAHHLTDGERRSRSRATLARQARRLRTCGSFVRYAASWLERSDLESLGRMLEAIANEKLSTIEMLAAVREFHDVTLRRAKAQLADTSRVVDLSAFRARREE
jgi:hypothetical protein